MASDRNLTRHHGHVARSDRASLLGQRGTVVWLTGLSGSGKSTIAYGLERRLISAAHAAFVLDGDNVRQGLCSDLGFSAAARRENIRRIGRVAALFADAGLITICAFISPYAADRAGAREAAGSERFLEVYLDVDVSVCEDRDPKGLYRRARDGEIENFTGVSAPYEVPTEPDMRVDTSAADIDACIERVYARLDERGCLRGTD